MYIKRTIEREMKTLMFQGKVLVVYGPRQSGKTTVIRHLLEDCYSHVTELNGDDSEVRNLLADCPLPRLERIAGGKKILFIDEAQRIDGIGLTLKRAVDRISNLQIIISGSSSLDLQNETQEPLTGRKFEWTLLPLSFEELCNAHSFVAEREALGERLIFGSYPEIIVSKNAIEKRLLSLSESYLFKDLLTNQKIRRSDLLERILKALSFQCGSEVSFNEVGRLVGADSKTIERYVDLLKKAFVIFEVSSYSRNLRNELKKSKKLYFYDNGIRNSVIGDLRPLSSRDDVGKLWENYLMSERYKRRMIKSPLTRAYFWRTAQQQEIDLIEECAEGISAFEFKWSAKKNPKAPRIFTSAYTEAEYSVVTPDNYDDFLM